MIPSLTHAYWLNRRWVLSVAALCVALAIAALFTVSSRMSIEHAEQLDAKSSAQTGGTTIEAASGAPDADGTSDALNMKSMASPEGLSNDEQLEEVSIDAKIVRNGALQLASSRKEFGAVWNDAQAVSTSFGGYVISAHRSGVSEDARQGAFTMRVPTKRFDSALDRLQSITNAKVEGLDVSSEDVTQEFVDVRSRLRHDRAVEERLMLLLARAQGVSEVLAVQSRLDSVQQRIEVARGRMQYLEKMTTMSTIEVTISAPSKVSAKSSERVNHGVIVSALIQAKTDFVRNAAAIIVWVSGLLPVLILLTASGLIGRRWWKQKVENQANVTAD